MDNEEELVDINVCNCSACGGRMDEYSVIEYEDNEDEGDGGWSEYSIFRCSTCGYTEGF